MRADRLVATLLLLQARGRLTAAEVAAELEVSLKTARRDLEALSLAGIPVYSQPGRGGGWQLLGGARTDLSGLTAAEARTLFLVAGPSASVTPAAKAALRKLMRALPETFRADAEAAAEAVVLDPTGWGKTPATNTPHMEELQRAVIEKVQVRLAYADQSGAESVRLVHPLGLVAKGGNWYLVADTANGRRTFRVSRIRSVTLTNLPAVRPDGFDLNEAWQSIAASVEERRTRVRATVNVDAAILAGLRAQLGADVTVGKPKSNGKFEAQIAGSSHQSIALQLAGWGKGIKAIDPEELRRELARIGAELLEVYEEG
jgi:predicted DNA-binding transcriptional regulator YafY